MKKIMLMAFVLLAMILLVSTQPNAEIYSGISGRVLDATTSKGVEGVRVIAETVKAGKDALTDKNGSYVLTGLPPGNYKLTFVKPDSDYIKPDAPQMDVVIQRGKNLVNVNYFMESGGSVTGKVLNVTAGLPIKDITVNYEVMNEKQPGGMKIGTVKTDNDGRYVQRGLPASDTVVITASVPGHPSVEKVVKVSAGKVIEADFSIDFSDITGIYGQVTSSGTIPTTGLHVSVRRVGSEVVVAQAVTDNSGKYSIIGLKPGAYDVSVFVNDTFVDKTVSVISGVSSEVNFELGGQSSLLQCICLFMNNAVSLLSTEAYALDTMPIAGGAIKVAVSGPNMCSKEQIKSIAKAFSQSKAVIEDEKDCKIGPRMRERLKLRLSEKDVIASCPSRIEDCNDIFGHTGCAKTVGYDWGFGNIGIRFCKAAFEQKCGCLEAVAFHELIHTVQWARTEKLPYACEKAVFPCGIIPSGEASGAGSQCEVNAWYYEMSI